MTFEVETFYNLDTVKSFGVAPHYSKKMRWWQEKFKSISLTYNLFTIKTNTSSPCWAWAFSLPPSATACSASGPGTSPTAP